ncbi:hypothetical protein HANVADRAFT_53873, partial [Hanseniaspora valbyensis NRRL Y-1626]
MEALKNNTAYPIADHENIKLLQSYVLQSNIKIDDNYYKSILSYFENILMNDSLRNLYINPFNKNIFLNIIYNDFILKKIKNSSKNGEGSEHFIFLEKLLHLVIKSYLININNYNYKSTSIRMIYLIFLNKEKDNKTPLLSEKVIDKLISRHDILIDIINDNVIDTYKDISSMCINIVKNYNKLIPLKLDLNEILNTSYKDTEAKVKYLKCLDIDLETKNQKELEFYKKINDWITDDDFDEHSNLNSCNNNLSLLNQFVINYKDEKLWDLLSKCIDKISPYISGDPSSNITNEFKFAISFKIYKKIIDIMSNIENLYLKIDFIHDLLLKLSNSACIHITIPIYKNLLIKLQTSSSDKHKELINNLNNIDYNHFGRRFGALPYMYQQLYNTINKDQVITFENDSLTAMTFEIKLSIVPYLDILKELNLIFSYEAKGDYVIDTYIVRFITGLVAYIVSQLKKKNFQVYKESIDLIVGWINMNSTNEKKEKLILSIIAQLVKYGLYSNKLDLNWRHIAQNKNWLIRKSGAELYYICNFKKFNLIEYINNIDLNDNSNQLQYHLFVLNASTKELLSSKEMEINSLIDFFQKILFETECFYVHLQVFKNINSSILLKKNKEIANLVEKYSIETIKLLSVPIGITELLVNEILQILKSSYLDTVLGSSYYEIALDYILKNKGININLYVNLLIKLYHEEKYDFIKSKIFKILEIDPSFKDYSSLIQETDNQQLSLEYQILNLEDYWKYYSSEDETLRLLALKKAFFSQKLLKQYQFESDNEELVANWYFSLNLPKLNDYISKIPINDIKTELKEIISIIINELNNNKIDRSKTDTLFEKDNFHNSSNLWGYVYILTKNIDIDLQMDVNLDEIDTFNFDIRILMIYKITSYSNLQG